MFITDFFYLFCDHHFGVKILLERGSYSSFIFNVSVKIKMTFRPEGIAAG